jgi:hypothetical protein
MQPPWRSAGAPYLAPPMPAGISVPHTDRAHPNWTTANESIVLQGMHFVEQQIQSRTVFLGGFTDGNQDVPDVQREISVIGKALHLRCIE